MPSPLISICLPNLNHRQFLEERLATILAQTVKDWELIICDSYSTDGSWEFFQKFAGDPRIRMYQVPREGVYAGWNECLRRATGRYIYIATSDDTMSPDCLARLLSPLERFQDLKISVCDFQEIDADSQPLNRPAKNQHVFLGNWMEIPSIRNGQTEFLLHAVFGTTWVTLASSLFRRDILTQTGLFRTDLGSRADEEWTLRASLASNLAFVPGKLVTWRIHPQQLTRQLTDKRQAASWLLTAIMSVLHDDAAGIPAQWKTIQGWEELLSCMHRAEYRSTYGLYRWELKQHPWRFLRNCATATHATPTLLVHQIVNLFGSDTPEPQEYAHRLIEVFSASWPPMPIPAA